MNRRSFLASLGAGSVMSALAHPLIASVAHWATHPYAASMWAYLWDLADEGYSSALGRMKDNGLTSISLACAYHAGKFLAPHNPKRKVIFLEDGTVYFAPTSSKYGRIRPKINSLVGEGHSLAVLRREAEKAGMETRAWVVCCHNTPLGMEHPDVVCRTAHGDPIYHNLCPSNEDVQTYLKGIVSDIASQGASVIELEAMQFQGYTHGFHHEREGITLSPVARFLLGLCFCSSCRRRFFGGTTRFDILQNITRTSLDAAFQDPECFEETAPEVDDLFSGEYADLIEWRKSVVASLAAELAEAVKGTDTKLRPLVSFDSKARALVGMDPKRVAEITGGVLMPGYTKDGTALRPLITELQALVPAGEIIVGFQVGLPESGGRKEFLSRVAVARELNIKGFNFYNYGFIPHQNLPWIREALES